MEKRLRLIFENIFKNYVNENDQYFYLFKQLIIFYRIKLLIKLSNIKLTKKLINEFTINEKTNT